MESAPLVVHCADLQRWCDTYTPGYAQMTEDSTSTARKSPFVYNPKINAKIAYWLVNSHCIFCVAEVVIKMQVLS